MKVKLTAGALALALVAPAFAHDANAIRADAHVPIGVMGDHVHDRGEWMLSYRFMRMEMAGNLAGEEAISPDDIVTSLANPHPGPMTVRVVPTKMTMDMHMLGAMYAPSDTITLMAMVNHVEKTMEHVTYQGMAGSSRLGEFSASAKGLGDTRLSALFRLFEAGEDRVVAQLGLSLPTGSIDETGRVLSPMNTAPVLTLPYPMQLGSGSFDPLLGLTWTRTTGHWTFGTQASAVMRVHDNDQGYRWAMRAGSRPGAAGRRFRPGPISDASRRGPWAP
jgi:hypothetical protein